MVVLVNIMYEKVYMVDGGLKGCLKLLKVSAQASYIVGPRSLCSCLFFNNLMPG